MTTTGPSGEKRPKDPIARAVQVAKIATGEIEEVLPERETELGRIAAEEAQRPTGQAEDDVKLRQRRRVAESNRNARSP